MKSNEAVTTEGLSPTQIEVERLRASKMMILPKDQKNRFWPDHDAAMAGLDPQACRPIQFWDKGGMGQTWRNTTLVLPAGISTPTQVKDNPLCFHDCQIVDKTYRSRVGDLLKTVSHDYSWMQFWVVTFADDRVSVYPQGTQISLNWSTPVTQPKMKAEAA